MNKDFVVKAKQKLVENLLSVKVWTIFSFLTVTSILCWYGKIDGSVYSAVNGGVIATVFALRESFKTAKIKTKVFSSIEKIKSIARKVLKDKFPEEKIDNIINEVVEELERNPADDIMV